MEFPSFKVSAETAETDKTKIKDNNEKANLRLIFTPPKKTYQKLFFKKLLEDLRIILRKS